MKKVKRNHRSNNWFHHWCHNRCHNRNRGSIMIWTVMLGLLLTSVFFFFSMRQRMMLSVQRDTAAMQNAKLYLESYADYLEKLCKGGGCSSDPKTVDADGIKGTVTQKVDSIENLVDFGGRQSYIFGGSIYVAWNRCSDTMKGDLLVNDVLYKHQAPATCKDYDDLIGPINVTSPFLIKTQNAPFYFKIKAATGTQLIDNQWHLEMAKDLDYGKQIEIRRTF